MSRLLLVRHGQIQMNKPEKFWGATDIELSPVGRRQAELLRDRLAGETIDLAYASPLSRAVCTAETICSPHHVEIITSPDLAEMNFGEFEGLTFDEISRTDPDTARLLMAWDVRPRFPGGESIDELNARIRNFISGLDNDGSKTILIVAHAGTLRMLVCNLLDLAIMNWRKLRMDMGSLSIVHTYPGLAILSLLNDISHFGGTKLV